MGRTLVFNYLMPTQFFNPAKSHRNELTAVAVWVRGYLNAVEYLELLLLSVVLKQEAMVVLREDFVDAVEGGRVSHIGGRVVPPRLTRRKENMKGT